MVIVGAGVAACGAPGTNPLHRAPATTRPAASGGTSAPPTTGRSPAAEWTTYGGGPARRSLDAGEGALPGAPTAAWTSPALDAAVYGEPLIFDGQVLVATENDTVYALSAETGAVDWSLHLATPAPSNALPCGDIDPVVGVTSTMVIDPASGTLFVSAEAASGGGIVHTLYAVALSTHSVRFSRGLDQPSWTAAAQLQRAALALDGAEVLVAFGGLFGDCGLYHGWVVGVPTSGSGALSAYEVPSAREAGIWEPAGPSVDENGDVYVATGNGSSGTRYDHGNSVIRLTPALSELAHFADPSWAADNRADADLGSTSPVLLGDGRVFEIGKQAVGYLLRANTLASVAPGLTLCSSLGATAYRAPDLYVVCTDTGQITEVQVGAGDRLHRGWTWTSPTGAAGSPTIARGVVWTLDPARDVLYGLDPTTGVQRYAVALTVGRLTHFASASAGEGLIVVAGSKAVEALR